MAKRTLATEDKGILDLTQVFWDQVHKAQAELPKAKTGMAIEAWIRPIKSDAMAVHPDQVPEAREDAKRKGVPTQFMADGRPLFTSSRHFRRYAKAYGFKHKGYC